MPARILVVDDAPLLRTALREFLKRIADCEVIEAENGLEAIARTEEVKPDLIILDYAMPRMDGLAATRRIHNLFPNTPILMHTLHHSRQLARDAEAAGATRLIAKSDTGDLIAAVRELLSPSSVKTLHAAPMTHVAPTGTNFGLPMDADSSAVAEIGQAVPLAKAGPQAVPPGRMSQASAGRTRAS